jgi:hypothetical protein
MVTVDLDTTGTNGIRSCGDRVKSDDDSLRAGQPLGIVWCLNGLTSTACEHTLAGSASR